MIIPKGRLIAIGGSEDKGTEPEPNHIQKNNLNFFEMQILSRIVMEAGGHDSKIEVITSASSIPEEVGQNYIDAFGKLGCSNIHLLDIRNRDQAQQPEMIERIRNCDGVMFTGGNQLRLSSIFGGTDFLELLTERYIQEDKFVIAGTSAGAMAMSNTMIYQGSSTESLLKGEVKITTGLAFMKDVIIDSHFVTRGRFGRLAQSVAANPSCMGIGLGEDTGVLISEGRYMEAIGSGLVIIIDGHNIRHSNIADLREGSPISIENLVVHVMAKGNHFDLKSRRFFAEAVEKQ
ncbi:MAG: cyanophycinase [Bacteroidetes bacterium]|nr:MAG: cyanophycinase [Bacteroidota bacterium]REK07670.1 MAG: cyanophycinase [Bacteroidota bacterium]REK33730.1 MAG: cyanophycinase [Bacteroidota bacterium]REK49200.1 MAG: cyanophycinase [Bacteroidota bacterium]